jgi:hypothetical protein
MEVSNAPGEPRICRRPKAIEHLPPISPRVVKSLMSMLAPAAKGEPAAPVGAVVVERSLDQSSTSVVDGLVSWWRLESDSICGCCCTHCVYKFSIDSFFVFFFFLEAQAWYTATKKPLIEGKLAQSSARDCYRHAQPVSWWISAVLAGLRPLCRWDVKAPGCWIHVYPQTPL